MGASVKSVPKVLMGADTVAFLLSYLLQYNYKYSTLFGFWHKLFSFFCYCVFFVFMVQYRKRRKGGFPMENKDTGIEAASEEKVIALASEILDTYREAFEELAK